MIDFIYACLTVLAIYLVVIIIQSFFEIRNIRSRK